MEEAGTYISSLTVVRNYQLAKDEITALASGVVQARIVGVPSVRLENDVIHVRVKARIRVDTSVLDQQIEQIMKEKGTLEKLEEERRKVKDLEKRLASLKSSELKRLEELNAQTIVLEMERERQRLFREEQRLKALGDIAKADLEILRQERERMARLEYLRREQEVARQTEIEALSKERDRIKRSHLENERQWKELARKAELSRTNWVPIDETLSLNQAIEEVKNLKLEIANLKERLYFQIKLAIKNFHLAYKKQINVINPILPPDPAPKDPFETSAEYNQRLTQHNKKVLDAEHGYEKKIKELKAEEKEKLPHLKLDLLKQKLHVLEPFITRLQTLQSRQFTLTKGKVEVILDEPEADMFRFPLRIKYEGKEWTIYWKYKNRKQAKAFWKTRSHLISEGLFQLESNGDGTVSYCFTAVKIFHPGTQEEQKFILKAPQTFEEVRLWNNMKNEDLSEIEEEIKYAKLLQNYKENCVICHEDIQNKLQKNRTKHSEIKCNKCHYGSHKMIPSCVECHGMVHSRRMMQDTNKCGDCHRKAHNLPV
ncbi:MAG: hypothetical protein JRE47_13730 [Deltaproteobacteria bacterium]|nr:hypothetical protein [Deltaproteobacteria bacterium]